MILFKRLIAAIFIAGMLSVSALAQGNVKVEPVPAPVATEVPKAMLDALEPQGARVASDKGSVCEIWLRKGMELGPPASGLGDIMYGQLGDGNWIGVLHFPAAAADFRGQAVKAGYYGLRYAKIPTDGAHMGAFPTRDTLALTPIADDSAIDQPLGPADLRKFSRLASGTPHPAFLVMSSAEGSTSFPSVGQDDHGNTALRLKVQGKNGELPIGITVLGKWAGE